METETLICTGCENHCTLTVEIDDDEVYDVFGNKCYKGFSNAATQYRNRPNPQASSTNE